MCPQKNSPSAHDSSIDPENVGHRIKNIKKEKNKTSDDKKEVIKLKKMLKETEQKLEKVLTTIELYRKLTINKQKELEKWQNLNAQLQTKVYEKLDEYGKCFNNNNTISIPPTKTNTYQISYKMALLFGAILLIITLF